MRNHLFALALSASSLIAAPAAAETEDERPDVKVAIVVNILRFTRLEVAAGQDVTLCVFGKPSLVRAFEKAQGQRLQNGRLLVRHGVRPSEVNGLCNVVYLARDEGYPPPATHRLAIGEAPGFVSRGAVALHQFGRQLSFEINIAIAARQGAAFSARLLNLADEVRTR